MSSIRDFYRSLPGTQQDLFVSVATDLQASAPPEKIERLGIYHTPLKTEIDAINRRRQSLGGMLNNITSLLKALDVYTDGTETPIEILLFKNNLQKVSADLKAEISSLKPEKKLEKKFDVARRREGLIQRRDLSGLLFSDVISLEVNRHDRIELVEDEQEEELQFPPEMTG